VTASNKCTQITWKLTSDSRTKYGLVCPADSDAAATELAASK